MLRIGDFSRLAHVTTRTLRYYNQVGLLEPAYTDQFTGYRYYTVEQLSRLNRILALRNLGVPLEDIVDLLAADDVSPEHLRQMLTRRQQELEAELAAAHHQLAMVEHRIKEIEQEGTVPEYDIVIKEVPEFVAVTTRQIVPAVEQMAHYCTTMLSSLFAYLDSHHITESGSGMLIYHNVEFTRTHVDTQAIVPVSNGDVKRLATVQSDHLQVEPIPGAQMMACAVHHGAFREMEAAFIALLRWMAANRYSSSGGAREIHLFGRITSLDKSDPGYGGVVEVQVPVEPI